MATAYPRNRGVANTNFDINADKACQLTGSGNQAPGNANNGGITPTYASTIAVDAFIPFTTFLSLTTTSAVGNSTVTTGAVLQAGARLVVEVNQYSGGSAVVTFGTGFRPTGTATPSSAKALLIEFVSDGTSWCECGRSVASV